MIIINPCFNVSLMPHIKEDILDCFVTEKYIGYFRHVFPMETPSKLYLGHPHGWGRDPWLLENIDIS